MRLYKSTAINLYKNDMKFKLFRTKFNQDNTQLLNQYNRNFSEHHFIIHFFDGYNNSYNFYGNMDNRIPFRQHYGYYRRGYQIYKCITYLLVENNTLNPIMTKAYSEKIFAEFTSKVECDYHVIIHDSRKIMERRRPLIQYKFKFVISKVTLLTKRFLGYPYESNCDSYKNINKNRFNSLSYDDCVRKCEIIHFAKQCNCQPFFLNDANIDIDDNATNLRYCSEQEYNKCNEIIGLLNIKNKCQTICLKDCIEVNFIIKTDKYLMVGKPIFSYNFYFNAHTPMLSYIETELLTLESLFCYIGGIYGIWFGLSVYSIKFNERNYFRFVIIFNIIYIRILKCFHLLLIISRNIIAILHRIFTYK
jgi:hypothetical protein